MKKYVFSLFTAVMAIALFTACTEEDGNDPGNDSQATVTLYQYTAEYPYDGDSDVRIRIAANSATTEAYALAETKESKEKRLAELGVAGYNDYVVANGEKLEEIKGSSIQEKVFTNLNGENIITVVAVGNGNKKSAEVSFTGVAWVTVAEGTYHFGVANIQAAYATSQETTLQYCESDPTTYRFKNLYGAGKHMKFVKTDYKYEDGGIVCRVPAQSTPLQFGSYGSINVRDVATWQNDDNFLDCALYDDNSAYFWVQYYVSAGNLGYGYDEFEPK